MYLHKHGLNVVYVCVCAVHSKRMYLSGTLALGSLSVSFWHTR